MIGETAIPGRFDQVDEDENESSPASDPPSRTAGDEEHPMPQAVKLTAERAFPWRRMVLWTFALVTVAYLLTRHSAHVYQLFPIIFLLACPAMHLFHHRRHRH